MAVLTPIDRYVTGFELGYAEGRAAAKKFYDAELTAIVGTDQLEGRDAIMKINEQMVAEIQAKGLEASMDETTGLLVTKLCEALKQIEVTEALKEQFTNLSKRGEE